VHQPVTLPPTPDADEPKNDFFGRRFIGEAATALYLAGIAFIALRTGIVYILFPELAALSHDILTRPHGTWAKAPLMLVVTPLLTAAAGTLVARFMPYGVVSILSIVAFSVLVIRLLRSPIAPAISAGLLPVTLSLSSWWYAPAILLGTGLLTAVAVLLARVAPPSRAAIDPRDLIDDRIEESPQDYSWVPFFLAFLVGMAAFAVLSGRRLLLFPPLVVMAFEMFAHSAVCPWAKRPLLLPLACALTAAGGVLAVAWLGIGPLAAVCSTAFGVVVLRLFDLHVPPALAVGLLPFVMPHPNYEFPVAVGIGTALLTASFQVWRRVRPAL